MGVSVDDYKQTKPVVLSSDEMTTEIQQASYNAAKAWGNTPSNMRKQQSTQHSSHAPENLIGFVGVGDIDLPDAMASCGFVVETRARNYVDPQHRGIAPGDAVMVITQKYGGFTFVAKLSYALPFMDREHKLDILKMFKHAEANPRISEHTG